MYRVQVTVIEILRLKFLISRDMSRLINASSAAGHSSSPAGSGPASPLLSHSGTHGIPLGRANLTQVAQSIDVAAVKALE